MISCYRSNGITCLFSVWRITEYATASNVNLTEYFVQRSLNSAATREKKKRDINCFSTNIYYARGFVLKVIYWILIHAKGWIQRNFILSSAKQKNLLVGYNFIYTILGETALNDDAIGVWLLGIGLGGTKGAPGNFPIQKKLTNYSVFQSTTIYLCYTWNHSMSHRGVTRWQDGAVTGRSHRHHYLPKSSKR